MTTGALTYATWKCLYKAGYVAHQSICDAFYTGNLPVFFEQKARHQVRNFEQVGYASGMNLFEPEPVRRGLMATIGIPTCTSESRSSSVVVGVSCEEKHEKNMWNHNPDPTNPCAGFQMPLLSQRLHAEVIEAYVIARIGIFLVWSIAAILQLESPTQHSIEFEHTGDLHE